MSLPHLQRLPTPLRVGTAQPPRLLVALPMASTRPCAPTVFDQIATTSLRRLSFHVLHGPIFIFLQHLPRLAAFIYPRTSAHGWPWRGDGAAGDHAHRRLASSRLGHTRFVALGRARVIRLTSQHRALQGALRRVTIVKHVVRNAHPVSPGRPPDPRRVPGPSSPAIFRCRHRLSLISDISPIHPGDHGHHLVFSALSSLP